MSNDKRLPISCEPKEMTGTAHGHRRPTGSIMQYHFEFDREHRILLVRVEGDIRDEDLDKLYHCIKQLAVELNPSAGITDLSGLTFCNLSSHGIWSAAQNHSPYKDLTARFLVAPREHVFGLCRMYQMAGGETRAALHVVRSREEACVQSPRFERVASSVASARV